MEPSILLMESQQNGVFVAPSLDLASSRLWWLVELHEVVDERLLLQYWRSHFWSTHTDSVTVRLLYLIVPYFLSTLLAMIMLKCTSLLGDYLLIVNVSPNHLCHSFLK